EIVQTCPDVTTPVATPTGQTTAQLSWANPGSVPSFDVEIVALPGTPTGVPTYTAVTSNPFNVTTGLVAGAQYAFYVRSNCGGVTGNWTAATNFTMPINYCTGTHFYDPGGAAANYPANANVTTLICPANPGDIVTVSFATFNTQLNTDFLRVYDGPNATYPLLATLSGTTVPAPISANIINGGCLTFVFTSNATTQAAGWDATVTCAPPPTCPAPSNLLVNGTTDTTATLSWTPGLTETTWEVIIQAPGAGAPTAGSTGLSAASNPYVATTNSALVPLTPATTYEYWVRAVCSASDNSIWIGPKTFTTLCSVINVPFQEGFNSTSPTQQCWTVVNANGDTDMWNMDYATNPFEGNQAAMLLTDFNAGANDDWLISPTLNLSATPGPKRLKFHYRVQSATEPNDFRVVLSTTGPATANFTETLVPLASYNNITYIQKIVNLVDATNTPYTGNVHIAWHVPPGGLDGWRLYIDNVIIEDMPACPEPMVPTFVSSTDTTATLSWTPGFAETAWEIVVQAPGSGAPTGASTIIPAGTNPFTVTDLTAGTQYEFYVRAYCSATNQSQWVGPVVFSTKVCNPINQCNYTFSLTDTFGDGWNGNTMSVRQNGIVVATLGPTFTTGTGPVNITVPLCHGIPFELFWNAGGSFATEVGISIIDPFTEVLYTKPPGTGTQNSLLYTGMGNCIPPTCPKPTNLTMIASTTNSITVGWTENGSAAEWEVFMLPVGSPAPGATDVGLTVSVNPYTFTDLPSGTAYVFYVRALCGPGDISTISGPINIYTKPENDECATAIVVPVNQTNLCTLVTPGTVTGATASLPASTCVGNSDDDVWFEFTATATTHSIKLLNIIGTTTNMVHALYQGSDCNTLTQIYCSDPDNSIANNLVIGQVYKIRVYTSLAGAQSVTFNLCVATILPPIATNITQYTVPQLVQDVLIGSPCASVSNITWSTGSNFGSTNGIGYFQQNGSAFPFADGIVLSTGNAMSSPGPNDSTLGDGNAAWPGDTQLFNYIQGLGIDTGLTQYRNASVLEFDFVPIADQMSFDFLFASEEYGTFQCSFSDAFAFFLTDVATGVTTNLAVVPGTTTPISVVTIRDNQYNTGCSSENPTYFGVYNGGVNSDSAAIDFNGQTTVMTAQSQVTPNNLYHIKLVIADRNDNIYDSAVFIKGGSFSIGDLDLGDDLLISQGTALCDQESYTLNTGLSPAGYTIEWFQDGVLIPGENGPSLVVTESGTYSVSAQMINGSCAQNGSVVIEVYNQIVPGTPNTLEACSTNSFAPFDLTANNSLLLGSLSPTDYTITHYVTQEDADNEVNPIDTTGLFTNTVPGQQTIYAAIKDNVTGCRKVTSFDIKVNLIPDFTLTPDSTICESNSIVLSVTPVNFNLSDVTFVWTLDGNPLAETTASITATLQGTYAVTVTSASGCSNTASTTLTVVPYPVVPVLSDVTSCDVYVLEPLSNGNYYTGANATGAMLNAGDEITTSQTIYIFAENGTAPNTCTDESSFNVTIVATPEFGVQGGCQAGSYVLDVIATGDYDFDDAAFTWTNSTGAVIGTGLSVSVSQPGTYTCTAVANGSGSCALSVSFTADSTSCNIQNGISPNGDGKNDAFDLTSLNVKKLTIVNRYGREVYQHGTGYTNQWHGQSSNGNELPDGTYFYVIEAGDGMTRTGWIYINKEL
ncbi:choice-of-anchor L domain-containing protein, partial [Flavobacterium suncheonense]